MQMCKMEGEKVGLEYLVLRSEKEYPICFTVPSSHAEAPETCGRLPF